LKLKNFQNKFIKYFMAALFFVFPIGCTGTQKKNDNGLTSSYIKKIDTENSFKSAKDLKPDYLKLSKELIKQRYYDVAIAQLEKVKKNKKNEAEIYFLMGKCSKGNKEYLKAEKNFQKAIDVNSDYAPAYNGLGLICDMTGKGEKAWKFYKKAISLNPARADFYNNLGFSEIIGKKYKEAKSDLLKSIALKPDFIKAKNNLALAYIMTDEDEKAFAILKNIYPLNIACYNMGALYIKKGDGKKADEMHKKAVELHPEFKQGR